MFDFELFRNDDSVTWKGYNQPRHVDAYRASEAGEGFADVGNLAGKLEGDSRDYVNLHEEEEADFSASFFKRINTSSMSPNNSCD